MNTTLQEQSQDAGIVISANILSQKDRAIRTWQRVSLCLGLATVVAISGASYVATRSTFIPYVINVDEQTGYAHSLGALTEVKRETTTAEIAYFLKKFVVDTRSVPNDKKILSERLKAASTFLTEDAAQKFQSFYLAEIEKSIAKGVNNVEILSFDRVSGYTNTYQIRWKETFTKDKPKQYVGIYKLEKKSISNPQLLETNPNGLFITDFTVTEENVSEGVTKQGASK